MTTLLFDFGGTIDTDGVHWSETFWEAYKKAGVTTEKAEFEKAYVAAEPGMYQGLIRGDEGLRLVLWLQVQLQLDFLSHRDPANALRWSSDLALQIGDVCFEEVKHNVNRIRPLLIEWSKEFKLGLVSNFYGNLTAVCRELNIADVFDAVIDSTVVGARKPNPAIFRIALEQLHASAAETFVVGDSYDRDIVPSKFLGCTTVWLRGQSWQTPHDISQADYVLSSLDQLQPLISERKHREEST